MLLNDETNKTDINVNSSHGSCPFYYVFCFYHFSSCNKQTDYQMRTYY